MSKNDYKVCINCGEDLQDTHNNYLTELYDVNLLKKANILKLVSCNKCDSVADYYVEHDTIIIIIDLVLLNSKAYHHILFNSSFRNFWKLALLSVICDGYAKWTALKVRGEFFEQEWDFYLLCIQSLIEVLVFFALILLMTVLMQKSCVMNKLGVLIRGLSLSYSGKLLTFILCIWDKEDFEEGNFLVNLLNCSNLSSSFVLVFILLSSCQVYRIVTKSRMITSCIVISLALFTQIQLFKNVHFENILNL